jgi:hypothetical protein
MYIYIYILAYMHTYIYNIYIYMRQHTPAYASIRRGEMGELSPISQKRVQTDEDSVA